MNRDFPQRQTMGACIYLAKRYILSPVSLPASIAVKAVCWKRNNPVTVLPVSSKYKIFIQKKPALSSKAVLIKKTPDLLILCQFCCVPALPSAHCWPQRRALEAPRPCTAGATQSGVGRGREGSVKNWAAPQDTCMNMHTHTGNCCCGVETPFW